MRWKLNVFLAIGVVAFSALMGCSTADSSPPDGGTPPVPDGGFYLSQVTPASGTALGGTGVTLIGGGFAPGATVWFGLLPADLVTVQDPWTIQAVTPPSPAGIADVTVRDGAGSAATLYGAYYFEELR